MTSDRPPFSKAGGEPGPDSEARILPFRRGPARGTGFGPVPGLTADLIPDLRKYHDSDGPDDYRHRMIVNLAAFLFVLLLIGAGFWIADTMARMRKNQDCVLSGRRGCTPVLVVPKDRW
jgi:hypothetical protein